MLDNLEKMWDDVLKSTTANQITKTEMVHSDAVVLTVGNKTLPIICITYGITQKECYDYIKSKI